MNGSAQDCTCIAGDGDAPLNFHAWEALRFDCIGVEILTIKLSCCGVESTLVDLDLQLAGSYFCFGIMEIALTSHWIDE